MKKTFLFLALLLVVKANLFAQMSIPNGSFEEWSLRYGKELPDAYICFDEIIAHWNIPRPYTMSRTSDAHSGGSALRIDVNTDSAYTYIYKRVPYSGTELPTLFRGHIKGTMFGDDTLVIYAALSKWNAAQNRRDEVASAGLLHQGPAQNFVEYITPFYFSSSFTPDSLAIYINVNSPWGTHTKTVGNWAIIDDLVMDFPSNTQDFNKKTANQLFPNPADRAFTLVTNDANSYELLDAFGKIFKTGILKQGANEIDTQNIANGLYFLKLNAENGRVMETKKLVIAR